MGFAALYPSYTPITAERAGIVPLSVV
jgi:hypothetical protein